MSAGPLGNVLAAAGSELVCLFDRRDGVGSPQESRRHSIQRFRCPIRVDEEVHPMLTSGTGAIHIGRAGGLVGVVVTRHLVDQFRAVLCLMLVGDYESGLKGKQKEVIAAEETS